jgi:hypothetical protein
MYSATKDEIAGLRSNGLLFPDTSGEGSNLFQKEERCAGTAGPPMTRSRNASDAKTFAPLLPVDQHHGRTRTLRFDFADWDWLARRGLGLRRRVHLNGYGVEGLVRQARWRRRLKASPGKILQLRGWKLPLLHQFTDPDERDRENDPGAFAASAVSVPWLPAWPKQDLDHEQLDRRDHLVTSHSALRTLPDDGSSHRSPTAYALPYSR